MNSFNANKSTRANDVTYRTVDDALGRAIPLDVLDIILGYTRYGKTHFHTQLLQQVDERRQSSEKVSPIFSDKVKYMLGRILSVEGRLNKLYLSYMLFDYVCDFRFLYRDSSLSLINIIKDKLNFFYFQEKIVNAHIYYTKLIGEDIDPDKVMTVTRTKRKLCSFCKLPGHDKRKCVRVDLFDVVRSLVDGYDRDGYNRNGYNRDGYDREGRDWSGYDRDGYDRDGYNRDGYNRDGYDREVRDGLGYNRDGYNRDGYDRDYVHRDGYNSEGYDVNGYDRDGYNRDDNDW
jgi:hypothetical protein